LLINVLYTQTHTRKHTHTPHQSGAPAMRCTDDLSELRQVCNIALDTVLFVLEQSNNTTGYMPFKKRLSYVLMRISVLPSSL